MGENYIGDGYRMSERVYIENEQQHAQELFHKKIWRVRDVAKFLGCSMGHIYNLASDERMPKRKKNGFLFFIPEEILNWVLEGDLK